MDQTPRVALLPSPGMGHLIPLVEFAKRLILQHNFSVTIILPTDGPLSKAQTTFLAALPAAIDYILLPPVNFDDLADDVRIETRISLTVTRSLPSLRVALKSLVDTTKLAALVVDLFGTDAFDVANEFKLPPYIFFPSTATALAFFSYLPKLHEMVACEFRDLPGPIRVPGCVPIHGRDLLDPAQDRKNDAYKWLLHHARRYSLAEGILVNSFKDLEPGPLKALQEQEPGKPPVYPVGPLIQMGSGDKRGEESECLKWLDDQPSGSVLYISFGSGGTLSHNQLIELAFGLEMSEQRFLWVVRSPNDGVANATYFTVHSQNDPLAFMPEGFLDRIKGRGFLLPSWAPQAKILGHSSTGGFLTHCGWNSTLESVVEGIPLIAWPLYAEQKMNAVMLAEDLKVALRPKADENGFVGRVEIANMVKRLMEGEEGKRLRSRMKELKDAAAKVLSQDGSSAEALAQVAGKWQAKICT
ncbi:hydroquinone glucosyltransferase-like [Coffea eugenioides]|uniref:hydroquinone glucosyltransferase-like n=1 Tax=Coffea eugenioides TaxID=49369 RepID=UPI000F60A369|nr:hydroquinone glucosyltransferase-like [Coffea eugenioides]